MAPTDGRVAKPEWRWVCCCGTPVKEAGKMFYRNKFLVGT